jgi:hypothetical protein
MKKKKGEAVTFKAINTGTLGEVGNRNTQHSIGCIEKNAKLGGDTKSEADYEDIQGIINTE